MCCGAIATSLTPDSRYDPVRFKELRRRGLTGGPVSRTVLSLTITSSDSQVSLIITGACGPKAAWSSSTRLRFHQLTGQFEVHQTTPKCPAPSPNHNSQLDHTKLTKQLRSDVRLGMLGLRAETISDAPEAWSDQWLTFCCSSQRGISTPWTLH